MVTPFALRAQGGCVVWAPQSDGVAVQMPRLGRATGYAPWLEGVTDGLPAWTRLQAVSIKPAGHMLGSAAGWMVEWAPWLDGTASWALRLLRVIVLHCFTGYTRPEAMLNSWAQLLAWLPAQVVLRMCSAAPGHLCPCFLEGRIGDYAHHLSGSTNLLPNLGRHCWGECKLVQLPWKTV